MEKTCQKTVKSYFKQKKKRHFLRVRETLCGIGERFTFGQNWWLEVDSSNGGEHPAGKCLDLVEYTENIWKTEHLRVIVIAVEK
jgi:hypothetical protein